MKKVSIILTNRNTKDYLELAITSIYKNNMDVILNGGEIIVLDDNSTDGSKEMLEHMENNLKNFYWTSHDNNERLGLMILNEAGIFFSDNELIFLGHSDMYYGEDCIKNLEKYIEPKKVICSTRIEPPIYPDEPIRYQRHFGMTPETFKEESFNDEVRTLKTDRLTEGVFAPTLMYKEDFCGYDPSFLPQSREDSRLFYQMAEKGVKFFQSWSSLVYHFSGKGSRKKDNEADSKEWVNSNYKNTKNFIRLYKDYPKHLNRQPDSSLKEVKLSLCVSTYKDESRIYKFLENVEPYFDEIIIASDDKFEDNTLNEIHRYIAEEGKLCETFNPNKFKFLIVNFNNDYSDIRNQMQEVVTSEWCFHADPDEYLPEDLMISLRNIIKGVNNDIKVFGIARMNYLENVLVNDIPRKNWNKQDLEKIKNDYENKKSK